MSFVRSLVAAVMVVVPFHFQAHAHSVSGSLGSVEVMAPGHYHFHAPLVIDLAGNLEFEAPSLVGSGAHEEEHGHGEEHGHDEGGDHAEGGGPGFTLIVTGDFDRQRRIVVKSGTELPADSWSVSAARKDEPRWLFSSRKFSFGAGPELHGYPVGLGLIPGKETTVFHRTLCTTWRCDEKPLRKLPLDISYWRGKAIGERVSYSKSVGLHVHVPIGPEGLPSLVLLGVIERSWQISVEKTGESQLSIKAGKDRIGVVGAELNAIVAGVGGSWAHGKDVHYDFSLDLSHPEAQANYERFLAARIDLLQQMAERQNGVKYLARGNGKSRTWSVSGIAGIPGLGGISAEKARTTVSSVEAGMAHHATVVQSVVRTRGVLSRHLLRGNFIAASVQRALVPDPLDPIANEPYFDLSALWIYEKERTSDERIERWLRNLGKKRAMPELARFRVDDQADGYLRSEVRVRFSKELIEGWLGIDGQNGKSVVLPRSLANSEKWAKLKARARNAVAQRNDKKLSAVLADAVSLSLKRLEKLRKEWIKSPPEFPVYFNVAFSGERLPRTTKTWMISR